MPNPSEVANVEVAGTQYRYWKEVEVNRSLQTGVTEATLVVAEMTSPMGKGWQSLRLPPGVEATIELAGVLAVTGNIVLRQVVYDGQNHAVRFGIHSRTQPLVKSTLDLPPGQFKNQTLTKLANAAASKFGVSFSLIGAPSGADKVFERVSVHMGESPFQFILRLAQMRNIHIFDDAQGNLLGMRGAQGSVGELREGQNILAAEMIWETTKENDPFITDTDQPGNNAHWGDKARQAAAMARNPNAHGYAPMRLIAPQPGDIKDAQMYADHASNLNAATQFTANVTVRGWLRDQGSCWLNEVGKLITLYSPMLLPQNSAELGIQAVTCRQSDGTGTTTTLELVLPHRLGNADKFDDSAAPATPDAAKPMPEGSGGGGASSTPPTN